MFLYSIRANTLLRFVVFEEPIRKFSTPPFCIRFGMDECNQAWIKFMCVQCVCMDNVICIKGVDRYKRCKETTNGTYVKSRDYKIPVSLLF